jgi:fatty-acyl-CoA synthase
LTQKPDRSAAVSWRSALAQAIRVVVWATNVPEWIVLQFALAKIGAILVTANTSLRAKDIEYLIRQCEASTVISIQGFRDVDYVGALEAIGAQPAATFPASSV